MRKPKPLSLLVTVLLIFIPSILLVQSAISFSSPPPFWVEAFPDSATWNSDETLWNVEKGLPVVTTHNLNLTSGTLTSKDRFALCTAEFDVQTTTGPNVFGLRLGSSYGAYFNVSTSGGAVWVTTYTMSGAGQPPHGPYGPYPISGGYHNYTINWSLIQVSFYRDKMSLSTHTIVPLNEMSLLLDSYGGGIMDVQYVAVGVSTGGYVATATSTKSTTATTTFTSISSTTISSTSTALLITYSPTVQVTTTQTYVSYIGLTTATQTVTSITSTTTTLTSTSYNPTQTVNIVQTITHTTVGGTVSVPVTQWWGVYTTTTTGTIQQVATTHVTETQTSTKMATTVTQSQMTTSTQTIPATTFETTTMTQTNLQYTTGTESSLSTSTATPPPSGLPFNTAVLVAVGIAVAALAGALLFRRWWTKRKQAGELPEEKPPREVPPEEGKPTEELISPEPAGNRICPQCNEPNVASSVWCAKCHTDIAAVPVTPATAAPQVAASIKCHNCGQQNAANTEFCTNCGARFEKPTATQAPSTPVAQVCPSCGTPKASPQALFCKRCGVKYAEAQEEQGTTTEEDERQIELIRETEEQQQGPSEASESDRTGAQ